MADITSDAKIDPLENLFPPLSRASGGESEAPFNSQVPAPYSSPSVTFSEEDLDERLIEELKPLLEKHYREIATFQDIPLSPDWEKYLLVWKSGVFVVYTVRAEGKLIGYAAFEGPPNLHYSTSRQSKNDVIFVDPAYRGHGIGGRLIDWSDDRLRQVGIQVNRYHIKAAHNWGPAILEPRGYVVDEIIYVKRLDK